MKVVIAALASCISGLLTFVSFSFMEGTWRTERSSVAFFLALHCLLLAALLVFVGYLETYRAYRIDSVRAVLLILVGGLGVAALGPYPAVFFVMTGRAFLNSGIAVLLYLGFTRRLMQVNA